MLSENFIRLLFHWNLIFSEPMMKFSDPFVLDDISEKWFCVYIENELTDFSVHYPLSTAVTYTLELL